MNSLVLGRGDVEQLLDMPACIDAVAEALVAVSDGRAQLPLRRVLPLRGADGALATMPATLGEPPLFGLKAISWFPSNPDHGRATFQGAVLLFEPEHGALVALVDASRITAIRTAAASGVATRALAREDARCLALLGSGALAGPHLAAIQAVRRVDEVRVWSRRPEHAERFAAGAGIEVRVFASAEQAVRGADIVCTLTAARTPVLQASWLADGAHVNAVGACVPSARELDTATMLRGRLFVDSREAALHESGDLRIPITAGEFDAQMIVGELGEVLLGRVPGRRSADEVTVFESVGLGVEDLAAAALAWRRARELGVGRPLSLD